MEKWEKMKSVDIRTVNRNDLVDILRIQEEENDYENKETQIKNFLSKVKNPYCFMVGDVIVKSTFTQGSSLNQRMQELADGI